MMEADPLTTPNPWHAMMKTRLLIISTAWLVVPLLVSSRAPGFTCDHDFSEYIQARQVAGAFLFYHAAKHETIRFCEERCTEQFIPASTFKILNAPIALATGAIKDENQIIPWDGIDRGVTDWNQDHNQTTALTSSVVWFCQEFARRIAKDRMQRNRITIQVHSHAG
jgi:beta-lactamase class D